MKKIKTIQDLDDRKKQLTHKMNLSKKAMLHAVRNSKINTLKTVMTTTALSGAVGMGVKLLSKKNSIGHIDKPDQKGLLRTVLPIGVRLVRMYNNHLNLNQENIQAKT